MPYQYVEGAIVLQYAGLEIRHVYKDDVVDNPPLEFWYETNGVEFDIRDLAVGDEDSYSEHSMMLKIAIDRGQLATLTAS